MPTLYSSRTSRFSKSGVKTRPPLDVGWDFATSAYSALGFKGRGALKIGLVAPVKPFHPYLVDDLAPRLDVHYLRIPRWLWFRVIPLAAMAVTRILTVSPVRLSFIFG